MLFLADESCDHGVVRALRNAGFEIRSVAEDLPGSEDSVVLDPARQSGRILVTEDKDFGQLVYADSRRTGGVILLRFPASARGTLPYVVVDTVERLREDLRGAFVVVEPGGVRVRRAPAAR